MTTFSRTPLMIGLGMILWLCYVADPSDAAFVNQWHQIPRPYHFSVHTTKTKFNTGTHLGAAASTAAANNYKNNNNNTQKKNEVSVLLKEFTLYTGEIVDPYQTLQISRQADVSTIKKAYRALCRQYHPDAIRYCNDHGGDDDDDNISSSISSCDNDDKTQNREQWERITWSYKLLTNRKQRCKYDRHYALAYHPGRTLCQAAWSGLNMVTIGLVHMGSMALEKVMTEFLQQSTATSSTTTTASATTTSLSAQCQPNRIRNKNDKNSTCQESAFWRSTGATATMAFLQEWKQIMEEHWLASWKQLLLLGKQDNHNNHKSSLPALGPVRT